MLYRGIEVTYETIREWCQRFGQQYANQLRRKRPYITDKWHLDEVVVTKEGAILFVASGGLGRERAGGVAPTAARYKCSEALLP